jgi:hypothetical protein
MANVSSFAYMLVASALHDPTTVDRVTAGVRADVDGIGGSRVPPPRGTRACADGGRGRIVEVDAGTLGSLATAVADIAAIHRLHGTRLGLRRGTLAVARDERARGRAAVCSLCVELVPIDIADTIDDYRRADPEQVGAVAVRSPEPRHSSLR